MAKRVKDNHSIPKEGHEYTITQCSICCANVAYPKGEVEPAMCIQCFVATADLITKMTKSSKIDWEFMFIHYLKLFGKAHTLDEINLCKKFMQTHYSTLGKLPTNE